MTRGLGGTMIAAACASLLLAAQASAEQFVLSGENNRLNAYSTTTFQKRTIIQSEADNHAIGLDINAQICFVPDSVSWKPAGETWFIAGEDTEQNTQPGVIRQGWGLFKLTGSTLSTLQATEVGKLVPDSYVTQTDNPENYGCGVLPDGRIITGDVGDEQPLSPATGQLIEWFPDASLFQGPTGPTRFDFPRVPQCKIDVAIPTAGGITVDGNNVYIAANRPNLPALQLGGIYKYDSTKWPTSETSGCGRKDATGKGLADADKVGKSTFIQEGLFDLTPSAIIPSAHDTFYVSSVFTGNVSEFDRGGSFKRLMLLTAGQLGQPGVIPQLNGVTPYGMGLAADGSLWIADIGVVGTGPRAASGSVVRLGINADGSPSDLLVIEDGLEFPDGIGVYTPPSAPAAAACSSATATVDLPSGARKVSLKLNGKSAKPVIKRGKLRVSLKGRRRGVLRVQARGKARGRSFVRNRAVRVCR